MAKITPKTKETVTANKAELPAINDEIFKLKIDRETQQFFIDENEKYGKFSEFTLRPLDMFNKIVAYNEEFEVKYESTLYRDLKEARDSTGATAKSEEGKVCGRIVWKNLTDKLTDEQKKINKDKAKFYVLLFGIAYIEGHEPILVDFRLGGTKFMEIINLMKKVKADKHEYNKAELKVKAYPSTDFDWPELEFNVDFTRELPVTGLDPLFDTIEGYVQYHNEGIDKKVQKYLDKKAGKTTSFKSNTYKRK